MKIENLLEKLPEGYSALDREDIQRAYQFAQKAHEGQKRDSGAPYITHCIEVALILTDLHVPPSVIIGALLHDTIEDTEIKLVDIKREFGEEIAQLVDGVSKLSNLPHLIKGDRGDDSLPNDIKTEERARSRDRELRNETLRKTFLAMSENVGVVLVKLADRLHNMRTLSFITPESRQKRYAQETLDIFSPLANRLGIWHVKWELEDLSFRYVNPEKYKEIANHIDEHHPSRHREIKEIIERLSKTLAASGIEAHISGRPKHIFSIYKKMLSKGKSFEQVFDLRGVRLIVDDVPKCYATLGIIHTTWRPIIQEFDDYIAAPKDNYYRSLHTTIIYDDGKPLEVQIRTLEMDEDAEYGIAAHWKYKETGKSSPSLSLTGDSDKKKRDNYLLKGMDSIESDEDKDLEISPDRKEAARLVDIHNETYERRLAYLRKLMEFRQDVEDAEEFVEGMKTDVFQDRVYVFTPKGDIIDLPAGSTPIDFAYHVHTEIGNRCRGAKVNGKLVNLDHILNTGDQVDILTAKQGGPSRDWLNPSLGLVNTQRGRSKIRQWFKRQDHAQNVAQGKTMLDRELRRLALPEFDVEKIAQSFDFRSMEGLYAALGCGDLSIGKVINRLTDIVSADTNISDPLLVPNAPTEMKGTKDDVMVLGLRGILTSLAHCCNPTPGDPIVGYITRGRGVSVHRQDCPNVINHSDKERMIKVAWGENRQTYPTSIEIKAFDRQGLMGDISNILNDENLNLIDIRLKVSHNLATFYLVVEVDEINRLSRLLTRIENLPNVLEAHRIRPG